MSIVAAAVTKYAGLSMSVTKPGLWFDGVPQTDGAGAATTLPWVNLVDEGSSVEQDPRSGFELEYHPIELTVLRFEVYAITLATVDGVMNGIKYGTGATTALLGFDFGTLTVTGQTLMELRRTREHRHRAPQLQETGNPVYQGDIWYSVQASVT